jgi:hypothetical protein
LRKGGGRHEKRQREEVWEEALEYPLSLGNVRAQGSIVGI